jgi:hypothetical protein
MTDVPLTWPKQPKPEPLEQTVEPASTDPEAPPPGPVEEIEQAYGSRLCGRGTGSAVRTGQRFRC